MKDKEVELSDFIPGNTKFEISFELYDAMLKEKEALVRDRDHLQGVIRRQGKIILNNVDVVRKIVENIRCLKNIGADTYPIISLESDLREVI